MEVKEAREKLMLSQTELGNILGVSWKTVSRWERGENKAKIVYLREIDKLVKERELEEEVTSKMIKAIRESNGLSQTKFAKELGVRQQTVASWESGLRKPRNEVRRKIYKFYLEHREV